MSKMMYRKISLKEDYDDNYFKLDIIKAIITVSKDIIIKLQFIKNKKLIQEFMNLLNELIDKLSSLGNASLEVEDIGILKKVNRYIKAILGNFEIYNLLEVEEVGALKKLSRLISNLLDNDNRIYEDTTLTQTNQSGTMKFKVEDDGDVEIKQDGKKQMGFRVTKPKQFIKDLKKNDFKESYSESEDWTEMLVTSAIKDGKNSRGLYTYSGNATIPQVERIIKKLGYKPDSYEKLGKQYNVKLVY